MKFQVQLLSLVIFLLSAPKSAHVKGQNLININSELLTDFIKNDVLSSEAVDQHCVKDLTYFMQKLDERRQWAMEMFDSWAKGPPSGVFYGNTINYGNFDQCLNVNHQVEDHESSYIKGKHCTITIQFEDPQRREFFGKDMSERLMNDDLRLLPQPSMNK